MLYDRFLHYIKDRNLCQPGDKVLLTVSGGVDSMVMMHLFARAGYETGVAHCNFQLRGAEGDEDELIVAEEARKLDLPSYNWRFDTEAEMAATGESVQMAARRLRYAWFDELCREHGYKHIAIAHHSDDSVETFFINLVRGTGIRGLTGIHVVNGKVIRPLLFATRKEIMEYALAEKIPYREDSSNASTKYLRNKIRLGLVPRIKEICPQFTATMTGNVERMMSALEFIDQGIAVIRRETVRQEGDRSIIDMTKINPELPLKFVLFELLRTYGFNPEVIDRLYASLSQANTGKRFYARNCVAYIDRNQIIITPISDDDECRVEADRDTRKRFIGGSVILFEHLEIDDIAKLQQPDNIALIDEDKITYPLLFRRWQEGDVFVPFGMSGRKKISDFLIDQKVSLPDKKQQFVLVSGNEIVWLVGRRVDDRFRVDSRTENVLKLTRETDTTL